MLSLITHFAHIERWESNTTRVTVVDPDWPSRSLLSKAWTLVRLAPRFDTIIFFYDTRVALLFSLLHWLTHGARPSPRLIFTTMLCDVSRFSEATPFGMRWIHKRLLWFGYALFVRMQDLIVVHSRAEIALYASAFRVRTTRFRFIPYCVRSDALGVDGQTQSDSTGGYVLAAGRNRDFRTFVDAIRDTSYKGIILGGEPDREDFQSTLPPNVEAHFEIPFPLYRAYIAGASVLVIPMYAGRVTRSLGQITVLEAAARQVPVIASRTPQLSDYFAEDHEILFYEPENPFDLKRQIERLMVDPDLRSFLGANAHQRMLAEYTAEAYTKQLLGLCCR